MPSLETLQNTDLAEEIEAINAIYEPDTITVTSTPSATSKSSNIPNATDKATTATLDLGSTGSSASIACTVTLQIPNQANLSLVVGFERSYPETRPHILGTASTGTGSRGEGRVAVDVVEDIVQRIHQPGAVCLFEVINEAIEAFEELNIGGKEESNQAAAETAETTTTTATAEEEHDDEEDYDTATDMATLSLRDNFGLDAPPAWILSDVVNEKKSIFVGRAAAVTSLDQAQAFLDHLLATEKKVAAATHNISAWRIREKRTTNTNNDSDDTMIVQDFDDDGETAAGGRLLHLMQLMDVWDVVVVVTRWYGGVQLGPDRFRIINAVGRDALLKGGFSHKGTTADKDKDKDKGKKKKGGKK